MQSRRLGLLAHAARFNSEFQASHTMYSRQHSIAISAAMYTSQTVVGAVPRPPSHDLARSTALASVTWHCVLLL